MIPEVELNKVKIGDIGLKLGVELDPLLYAI